MRLPIITRILALLAAAWLAVFGFAESGAAKPVVRYAKPAEALSFELFRGNRIFFQGSVNGHPASILLDSGADHTVIDAAFAKRIGLAEGRVQEVRGAGGTIKAARGSNVAVSAGPFRLEGASVLLIDLGDISRQLGRPLEVILGMEAFRAGIVDIDFSRRTLHFRPHEGFMPPRDAVAVPVTNKGGRRTIPLSIGSGPEMPADLDLGNGGTLLVSKGSWRSDPALAALPWAPTTALGVGGRVQKRSVTLPSVTIGGQRFENVPAVLNEGAKDLPITGANVGLSLLQRFRLIFHYARSTLYLVPDAGQRSAPFPRDRVGMRVELAGDRLRVAEMVPGGPAEKAGWRVGDEVISVNGARVGPDYYNTEQSRWGRMPAGTKLHLVRGDGKPLPVVLRDFF